MPRHFWPRFATAFSLVLIAACAGYQAPMPDRADPERATGVDAKQQVVGRRQMVVAANPHAARIGHAVLERGGSALDAAVAVQASLTLVEPQSSGLGGGAFILYWDAGERRLYSYDARETAPASATPELFMEDGVPLAWRDAIVGGRSVGVPGVLRGLEVAHRHHGRLPWSSLFEDAAVLAERGFRVSPRLAMLLAYRFHPGLEQLQPAADYFYPQGKSLAEGSLLRNPELAHSLRMIAQQGADYFYRGPLAEEIVRAVRGSAIRPGLLTLEDMAGYRVRERDPLCGAYHAYRVCSMQQPSSGGLALLQMLALLEPWDIEQFAPDSVDALHLFTQASRLAYADRDRYAADPDFVPVPVAALLDADYLARRGESISLQHDMGHAVPGEIILGQSLADDDSLELASTSHMSIIDQYGNALSMTTSIEMAFGSSLMAGGFLLNNQLTDFSLSPQRDGKPVANRVEPGKRPRSSMTPVIVFDQEGGVKALLGSPGGSRIIDYVAKALLGLLDWDLGPQEAVALPNIANRNDQTTLEKGRIADSTVRALERRGHEVQVVDMNSGLHVIEIKDGLLLGGADPRREGIVVAR